MSTFATTRRPRRRQDDASASLQRPVIDLQGIGLLGVSALLFLALMSSTPDDLPSWVRFSTKAVPNDPVRNIIGPFGAVISGYLIFLLGAAAWLLPSLLGWLGMARLVRGIHLGWRQWTGMVLTIMWAGAALGVQAGLFATWQARFNILGPGGGFGYLGELIARRTIERPGFFLVSMLGIVHGILLLSGARLDYIIRVIRETWSAWRTPSATTPVPAPQRPFSTGGPRISRTVEPEDGEAARLRAEQKVAQAERRRLERELKTQKPEAVSALPPDHDKNGQLMLRPDPFAALDYDNGAAVPETPAALEKPAEKAASKRAVAAPQPDPAPMLPLEPEVIDGSQRKQSTDRKITLAEWRRQQAAAQRRTDDTGSVVTGAASAYANYQLPPLDLLHADEEERPAVDATALRATQQNIIRTLATFGIKVTPGIITKGPTITRYEIYPAEGLSVKKIASAEADLARATCAERINILAPIPGKDTVGIEIANSDKVAVTLREMLEDDEFTQGKLRIPLALGKDVYGHAIIADLAAMPHLLVAGATGSGKSVCINSVIASLLFQFTPEQLRFIMIDPKVVEMQQYNDLPHLVVPVVTEPKKVIMALRWVVTEMESRYRMFADESVRNFEAFNNRKKKAKPAPVKAKNAARGRKAADEATPLFPMFEDKPEVLTGRTGQVPPMSGADETFGAEQLPAGDPDEPMLVVHQVSISGDSMDEAFGSDDEGSDNVWEGSALIAEETEDEDQPIPDTIPYIVVIIDELADLMQTAPADMEGLIARIAQKARAAGIHMILATQTPRAEVITGVIKANIPSRIAFQVSSALDSRVILDNKGAEKLVGKGDMLYLPPGTAQLRRGQGAYITDDELHTLVEHCKQQGTPQFEVSAHETILGGAREVEDISPEDQQALERCIEVVLQERKASTSLLQRRLKLGYGRAARMMDLMEQRGIIGPGEGAKPREVLLAADDDDDEEDDDGR